MRAECIVNIGEEVQVIRKERDIHSTWRAINGVVR